MSKRKIVGDKITENMIGKFQRRSTYIKINILVPDNLVTPLRRVGQGI